VVYYSMDNLRGRLGSTRKTKRGRGCDAASSSFDPANASAMQAHFRPELTGSAPKTFGECGRYLAAVIEGITVSKARQSARIMGMSDLSRSFTSERFDARLHGAGTNDEENAGRYSIRMSATSGDRGSALVCERWAPHRGREIVRLMVVSAPYNTAPHCYRNHGNLYIEEGMHTRSQQIFSSRSRMGNREPDAHARDAAVAQRLHSDLFGGGETRHANAETSLIFGEISEVRQPASFSL
jgi:hypothetical protein